MTDEMNGADADEAGGSVVVDDVLDGGGGGMIRSILDRIDSMLDVILELSRLVQLSPRVLLVVKL